ncbi:helix-turn-helix transcriptional regulator [Kosakonia radicincitans]
MSRNVDFSQTRYFCKVFRQICQLTPQAFRLRNNANYKGD